MTVRPRTRSRIVLAVALSAAFAVLAHLTIAEGLSSRLGAGLALLPLIALVAGFARRSRRPVAGSIAMAIGGLAVWFGWERLQQHFSDLLFVEHAALNVGLALLFGHTLVGGREPLCTRFARLVHGGLPPGVAEYTRGLTLAWTVFFVAMLVISAILYLGGFIAVWSFFASILSPLLVIGFFVIEYAVRSWVLPDVERVGILGAVGAFSRHFETTRAEANR